MRHILLSIGMVVTLSACGDPLRNIARLSDVTVDGGAATVARTPTEATNTRGGLFSRLLNRTPEDPTNAAVEAALADTAVSDVADIAPTPAAVVDATPQATPDRPRTGLADCSAATPTARQFRAQGPMRKMSKREQSCPLVRSRAFAGCAPMNLAPKSTRPPISACTIRSLTLRLHVHSTSQDFLTIVRARLPVLWS
ncbi:hypothetical protein N8315_08000 [Octadecabacter sp.]|nr:hypothetical protein [Octadecabacter sp.]MDC1398686.1 hypothetical protein [Octadecabacter sp.]